jgi:hypothetical protein
MLMVISRFRGFTVSRYDDFGQNGIMIPKGSCKIGIIFSTFEDNLRGKWRAARGVR